MRESEKACTSVRLHAREHVREDRGELFAKYAATIEHQRQAQLSTVTKPPMENAL